LFKLFCHTSLEDTRHRKEHGIYLFVTDGGIAIEDEQRGKRDGIGLWEIDQLRYRRLIEFQDTVDGGPVALMQGFREHPFLYPIVFEAVCLVQNKAKCMGSASAMASPLT